MAAHQDEPRAPAGQRGRRARPRAAAAAQKKARAGRIDLLYLDECGFSPTQPTGYSWALRGTRKLVRFENPVRRRVNALVAYRPLGLRPGLRYRVQPRTLTADDVVGLLRRLPSGTRPCVVVLDNVGIHVANRVRKAARALRHRGLTLFYLPAYSPELNDVEAVLEVLKGYELPERSFSTLDELLAAVRRALRRHHLRLRYPGQHPCPGA
ncbi:IS630 family transposase [Aggregicoccus sp. 17bor-14]|uniref:IS630 family transposase n=1 Tax=Myxococcaceae TaxID=31 RepID=UPI00129C9DCB|nr:MULTISPECIES: IS630 family transposase [Myxococcaceae]MBF5046666.1 IS630 family transposase [Simulacricoccus sp. 17bor-14]MRI92375.1 IS630 family transposase [Aggregicoccus sp. 17bor-14]